MKIVSKLPYGHEFENKIYGGWQLQDKFPELFTTGVAVVPYNNNLYFVREDGKPLGYPIIHSFEASSCFIDETEVQYFTILED